MGDNYISIACERGSISISEDVIAIMAAAAISEVEGVAGSGNTVGAEIADFLGKKSVTKGVKVCLEDDRIVVDAFIMVRYGYEVTAVAQKVQQNVAASVESMTGLSAPVINVHVSGVAFDRQ